jgi:hypothetical protein
MPRGSRPSSSIHLRPSLPSHLRWGRHRRKGEINDANWAKWEQEIFAAANQGRIAGALDKDGNKLTELR